MADLAIAPNLLKAAPTATAADLARRGEIKKTAQNFEAQFLSVMLGQMFTATDLGAPFGGGPGEDMFKSFMTDAFAKQMAKAGGIGVADAVGREMLKMQGLTE
jgi:Rod binding domain-containing protein